MSALLVALAGFTAASMLHLAVTVGLAFSRRRRAHARDVRWDARQLLQTCIVQEPDQRLWCWGCDSGRPPSKWFGYHVCRNIHRG